MRAIPAVQRFYSIDLAFIFIFERARIHLPATHETCTPVWSVKGSCQVQSPDIYVRQRRIIPSLSQERSILHANLELCFPSKVHDSRWFPPELGPSCVCFHFTNKIYNPLTPLTPTPTVSGWWSWGGGGGVLIEKVCITFTATTGKIRGDKNQQICQN